MEKPNKQNPAVKLEDITKKQLDKLKLVNCETYDSVIVRLIEIAKRK